MNKPYSGSLLIVDDDEANRSLLCRYLARKGYTVLGAEGGIQAIECIEKQTFDLIVLDVMMPGLDGFDVLAILRKTYCPATLPIIMATADNGSESVVKALSCGANDYVTKPLDLPVVSARVYAQVVHKQAQQALREAKEAAEAANQAKNTFLANMSHELRTPLHAILSFAGFGRTKVESAPPTVLQRYFELIDCNGRTLLELLNTLLDLAKLEAGKTSLDIAPVDAHALLSTVCDECKGLAMQRDLHIDILAGTERIELLVDAGKIKQVVRNLLSNALKVSPPGRRVTLQLQRLEDHVLLEVADEGAGIPPKELESIFDKFVQSSTTTTGAGGTGLGLAICREIVSAHRGSIWAKNRIEGGACFSVILPYLVTPTNRAVHTETGEMVSAGGGH